MFRESTKPGYLVMGLVFLAASALWGLDALDVGFTDTDQFGPILLIVLGVLGVAASLRAMRRTGPRDGEPQDDLHAEETPV